MKDIIKNNWQIILLETLVLIIFAGFYGKFGDIMIDSYREIYIPQQIMKGNCLYKDIFVIYPPLAYLINSFLIKIFGLKLPVFYACGLLASMGIIFLSYKLTEFFNKSFAPLAIGLFIIAGFILSPNVFNGFLPYSYGILYGILFTLTAIYFAFCKKSPLTYLFYSLAILCKYEFILLLPLLIFYLKKQNILKNIIAFFLPVLITLIVLILQGLRFENIKATIEIINTMSKTETLYWFYSVMGLTFRLELIPIYIINFIKFLIPVYWVQYQEILVWLFPFITIATIFRYKSLTQNERFFIIATLLISIKVFFALTLQAYGVYFLPFALISLYILTPQRFKKYLTIILIIWSFIIGSANIQALENKKNELNSIVTYIKQNTQSSDKVVTYPECLAINVLADRKSDNKFYSLIPLYTETFGEDLIIKRLDLTKPEYIITNNYDTSAYYFKNFGIDYGKNIQKWIEKNYSLKTIITDLWEFKIYKLK